MRRASILQTKILLRQLLPRVVWVLPLPHMGKKLLIVSNRILKPAIHIYEKAGLCEVPHAYKVYERAGIQLEYDVGKTAEKQ